MASASEAPGAALRSAPLPALLRAVDWFLPARLRPERVTRLRARVLVVGCIGSGLAIAATAAHPLGGGHGQLAWLPPIALIAFASLPFLLRLTGSPTLTANVTVGLAFAALGLAITMGGERTDLALPAAVGAPMFAVLIAGRRVGVAWSALLCGLLVAAAVATWQGVHLPLASDHAPVAASTFLATALASALTIAFGLVYETIHQESLRRSERAVEKLAAADRRGSVIEARARVLVEGRWEGVTLLDGTGSIVYRSPGIGRRLGYGPNSPDAKGPTADFVHPDDFREAERAFAEVMADSAHVARLKVRLRHADGGWRIHECEVRNRLDDPTLRGIVMNHRDVTERDEAESSYRQLVHESTEGVTVVSAGKILFANPAMARVTGYSVSEMLEWSAEEMLDPIPEPDRAPVWAQFADAFEHGASKDPIHYRMRHKDGSLRWVEARAHAIRYRGTPAVRTLHLDITDRRVAEEELTRHRERLEELVDQRTQELDASREHLRQSERLASVGTLAAGLAHQINNPVGAIRAAAEYALLCREDPDGQAIVQESLERVRAESMRCARIVRSILRFAQEQTSPKQPELLNDVVRRARLACHQGAAERRARLELDLDPELGERRVELSAPDLEQALIHLFDNAIESRPSGAQIEIQTRLVDGCVRLRVDDDGCGIPEENLPRLFDPFFTTRLREGATGLGLSVAHGIVADHAGALRVEERPGGGTRVEIELPV